MLGRPPSVNASVNARTQTIILSVVVGCTDAAATGASGHWVTVGRDGNYTVAIDTATLKRGYLDFATVYYVSYHTRHAVPRLHDGKKFNRELVRSVVRCDSL